MTRVQKIAHNQAEKLIEAAYYARCSGVAILVMDIGKVFAVGRKALSEGCTSMTELGDKIAAYVETIRKN